MRTEAEMAEAVAYWKKAVDDAAKDPRYAGVAGDQNPIMALFKGIVWALEWAEGRDREEIVNEAMKEEWIRRLVP